MADDTNTDILQLTAEIVSAHISHSHVVADGLPELIQSVYRALATAGTCRPAPAPPTPVAPIRKSVFPDHIVCLEDGMKLKTLKRHLQASHGMTPDAYRQKWGLPASYPMVAPKLRQSPLKHGKTVRPWPKAGKPATDEPGGDEPRTGPAG